MVVSNGALSSHQFKKVSLNVFPTSKIHCVYLTSFVLDSGIGSVQMVMEAGWRILTLMTTAGSTVTKGLTLLSRH